MSEALRPKFVFFGSSIVQHGFYEGWIATLAHLYSRKADIVMRGYFGWNSRLALQVLDKIFPKDAQVQPSLVIVYFGGNDSATPHSSGLGSYVPLQEYVANMKKIANHIKSLSNNTRILFLSTPPINEAKIHLNSDGNLLRTNEACRIYSEACLEMCREMNIKVIDLWSAIQTIDQWQDVCLMDGIHLSTEGSKIVSNEILKILKEVEWEPSLYWKSMASDFDEDSPYYPVTADGKSTLNLSYAPYPYNNGAPFLVSEQMCRMDEGKVMIPSVSRDIWRCKSSKTKMRVQYVLNCFCCFGGIDLWMEKKKE